jgi:hypothetical protein
MTRVTDVNTDTVFGVSNPSTTWQTADAPSVNLWNTDDTAFLGLVNGGGDYVFLWDGRSAQLLLTATNGLISLPTGTVFSKSARDHIYALDNTTGPGIQLQDNTIVLTQHLGSASTSNLFDFAGSSCLMNTVNGYPSDPVRLATITSWSGTGGTVTFQAAQRYAKGQTIILSGFGVSTFFNGQSVTVLSAGLSATQFEVSFAGYSGGADTGLATAVSFPLNEWTGAVTSADGIHFSVPFSLLTAQGGGYYQAAWAVGQPGCDLYNTLTGTVTHNGTLLGTIPDRQWGGAYGGKADRFKIHDSNTPNATYVATSATSAGGLPYGTYNVGDYFWQVGTTNVLHCGLGAPNWIASNAYQDGNRVVPLPASNNPGGYIFQIINGVPGTSGSSASIFATTAAQTPGSDTIDSPGPSQITWRNVGIGTAQEYPCDGHAWKGQLGEATGKSFTYHSYADPSTPLLTLGPGVTSAGDQHLGNTDDNTTDTRWPWVSSTDVGTTTDLLHGTFPSALYMEGFHVAPPYYSPGNQNCAYDAITCPLGTLGQVRRQFHCYGTGWHKSFDVQNCISVISQTGKYALLATDFMGENGSTVGTPGNPATFLPKCNPGGPMWNSNDNADYPAGTVIYPILSNDSGDYLYKVQSCSASPCTTGATQPDWSTHQSSTVAGMGTFVDGNITWAGAPDVYTPTNTAVQNCRADLMVVKLMR